MLELVRKGQDVYHNSVKLTRVDQATKGPGNEVIKIDGLEGSNGAKWISLSKLVEGMNKVEVSAKKVTSTGSYTLTQAEKTEVDLLQAQIDKIKETAKSRYVQKPKFVDPTSLTPEQREQKAAEIEKYLKTLRG